MRYQSTADSLAPAVFNCAVAVDGAPNVLAETVKRGEDDGFASSSVAGGVKKGKKHIIVRCVRLAEGLPGFVPHVGPR